MFLSDVNVWGKREEDSDDNCSGVNSTLAAVVQIESNLLKKLMDKAPPIHILCIYIISINS